jgi:hypothetical protein
MLCFYFRGGSGKRERSSSQIDEELPAAKRRRIMVTMPKTFFQKVKKWQERKRRILIGDLKKKHTHKKKTKNKQNQTKNDNKTKYKNKPKFTVKIISLTLGVIEFFIIAKQLSCVSVK